MNYYLNLVQRQKTALEQLKKDCRKEIDDELYCEYCEGIIDSAIAILELIK